MLNKDEIRDYLSNDDGLKILKTIDALNPIELPTNKLCTIKQVSETAGIPLKEAWALINKAYDCGLVVFYGGMLSRKRVDLTEIGEDLCDCTTAGDIGGVLNAL